LLLTVVALIGGLATALATAARLVREIGEQLVD
jgi:hypothetical protein